MPLPNSGAGGTLPGGPSGSRGEGSAGGALSRQETLFGISPEQLTGRPASEPPPPPRPLQAGPAAQAAPQPPAPLQPPAVPAPAMTAPVAPPPLVPPLAAPPLAAPPPAAPPPAVQPPAVQPPAVQPPALPAGPANAAQTFFGVAPQGVYPAERRKPDAVPPQPPPPAAPAPTRAGAALIPADAPIQNRTLLGVVPDEVARAVAAARERAPAPVATPPVATTPAALPARPDGTVPALRQSTRAPSQPAFDAVRAGGTIVGGAVAAARPSPARAAFEPAPAAVPLATPRVGPAQTAFEGPSPVAAVAPRVGPAQTAFEAPAVGGTVRSSGGQVAGVPRGPIPFGAESLEIEPDAFEPPPPPGAPALPIHARTALGVAIPGIAPLHAGAGKQPSTPAPRRTSLLEETQLQPDSLTTAPLSARPGLPRGAFVLLGSGLALLIAAAAFALLWKASKPISVAISADPSGKDRIDLVCQECPDGTLVSLNAARTEIVSHKAYLTLPEPLPLGESRVSFGLQKPGASEPEAVALTLPPIEYRIRPDTSTLVGDQPRLTLKIAAIPGSQVEIARQPLALDAAGNGEIAVELAGELIGPASEVTSFEQSIAYRITPPSGKTYEGELAFKIGVTPLLLEAPGIDTVTNLERFMLAGRTTKGAELWVAGTTIAVDGSGRFAQLMSIDSVGETRVTVRATEPGLAPRFVSFRLQRVENLEREAAIRRQKALPLASVARRIADHVGSSVVVSGRVEEVRADGQRSLIVLQPDGGCDGRSCLVRLVYGGLRRLARGESITAIGRLQGAVAGASGGGGEVPEVDVALLM